jgi:hypothetical protein
MKKITRHLPNSAYNWTTMIGAVMAVVTFGIILLLMFIEFFVHESTIYMGLLTTVVLPIFLILGLILIPVGMLREKRRLNKDEGGRFPRKFSLDLNKPAYRNAILIFIAGTAAFLMISTIGMFWAFHQTESVEFCGTTCHTVMLPEYTAYKLSAHARVSCVECHIGAGTSWYVKSKLSGAYQFYATLANKYPRPIPTPVENLRPAQDTCEQCHWPDKFAETRQQTNPHFFSDRDNTPYPVTLQLKIGGGSDNLNRTEGIHWHVAKSNQIRYVARDHQRLEISRIWLTNDEGNEVEYQNAELPLSPEELAHSETRTMDCLDCHNRPSHKYLSPNRTVNEAMARGRIDPGLPYIKQQAVLALDAEYESTPEALAAIEEGLIGYYREELPEVFTQQRAALDSAVVVVKQIFQENFFPEMKVDWEVYPDHIGHSEFIGCFRCHGSALETATGERISQDCDLCHTIQTPQAVGVFADLSNHNLELGVDCLKCHSYGTWTQADKFSHDDAQFPLAGAHEKTDCDKCHPPVTSSNLGILRYRGLEYGNCIPCHDDPHLDRFGTSCRDCHNESDWRQVPEEKLDHAKTGYLLEGKHASVECAKCHRSDHFIDPIDYAKCTGCHEDKHLGQFADRSDQGECDGCHSIEGFMPARYDLAEHQQSRYPLELSHAAVPCNACHVKTLIEGTEAARFDFESRECRDCHLEYPKSHYTDVQEKMTCRDCHSPRQWKELIYDHGQTEFALTGKHPTVACLACHTTADAGTPDERVIYQKLPASCFACHGEAHMDQFAEESCENCHDTQSWQEILFEHNRDSSFKLEGKHVDVTCQQCHLEETTDEGRAFRRFKPIDVECRSCHAGDGSVLNLFDVTAIEADDDAGGAVAR